MKKRTCWIVLCFGFGATALAIAGILLWTANRPAVLPTPKYTPPSATTTPTSPFPSATPEATPIPWPAAADGGFPQDRVFVTQARKQYQSGSMRLIIPKLNVDVPVLNGVDEQTLLQGEGLYDYAQLPSEVGGNVSIAGHRNWVRNGKITDDVPFYYLHTIGPGDCLYLVDDTHIYQYVWNKTSIIENDDWSVIYCQGFSCLTLTTCTPIGKADHRYIVRARQVATLPYSADYDYPAWQNIGTAEPSPIPSEEVTP